MGPRIAIPMPHGSDPEYAQRAIPQYERAVEIAGGEPVRIPLDGKPGAVKKLIEGCDGVLLPGSKADIDPARFGAARSPHTAASDPRRDEVDHMLLDEAYRQHKPVLGICYGLQSLNVYRGGSLVQHIPDFLPEETRARVNHAAGKAVDVAHQVEIDPSSMLARILLGEGDSAVDRQGSCGDSRPRPASRAKLGSSPPQVEAHRSLEHREGHGFRHGNENQPPRGALAPEAEMLVVPVNSSHHQSAQNIGEGLRVVAHCATDGIIEALEGTSPNHFVLAVQWHPERSLDKDDASLAIFRALVTAAESLS
jgi:putative glutamine amidotransferase